MNHSISDVGIEWMLLGLRVAFIAVLYIFLFQIARLMLREIRAIAANGQAFTPMRRQPQNGGADVGLVVLDPGETVLIDGAYLPIAGEILVGRGDACDLVLDDPFVSTEHAEFAVHAGTTVLTDLGSTNGSRVNGEWVASPVTLFDGDIVQFGNVRLRYAAAINGDGSA
jgi:hypothetical protein